jgi:outer membrane protein insertion porin family
MKVGLSIILLLITGTCLHAQHTVINAVEFGGLKKSNESYLQQFVFTKVGDQLDSSKVEADRQRLVNLETLAQVTVAYYYSEGVRIVFNCTEAVTLLPIFGLGTIRNNFWSRVGLQEANLRGWGNKIVAFYQYYDRHTMSIYYASGRKQNSRWTYTANVVKWSTLEPAQIEGQQVDYEYDNYQVGASLLYHFTFTNNVEVAVNAFYEEYTKDNTPEPQPGPDYLDFKKGLGRITWRLNKMNYHFYLVDGVHNTLTLQTVRTFDENIPFVMLVNEFRYAKRFGKFGNLATRLRTGIATNNNSPFAPFTLDSFLNIRGVGNRVDRGTGSLVLNTEYRQTFFDRKQIAAQAVVFSDAGTWRKPGGSFADIGSSENRRFFGGVGLRLIYKKAHDVMLRVDYGTDFNSTGGFVIGIGQYF